MRLPPILSRRFALAILPAAIAVAAGGALAQGSGHAHAHAQHGGQAQKIGRYEAELVVRGAEVALYVLDEADRPVDAAGLAASAQVLASGNQQRMVELRPTGGNRLAGRAEFQVDGRFRATVTLREAGGAEIGRARYTLDAAR
ncbi:MAG TPA: hypothetical protein VGM87_10100 [Roseomonas sp.]|jgi:nitrogen fixation protein FixH